MEIVSIHVVFSLLVREDFEISTKKTSEAVFSIYTCFHVFYLDPESNIVGLALRRTFAALWREVSYISSRPAFVFSMAVWFEVFPVLSLSDQKGDKRGVSRDMFISTFNANKIVAYFICLNKSRPKPI